MFFLPADFISTYKFEGVTMRNVSLHRVQEQGGAKLGHYKPKQLLKSWELQGI